MLLADYRNAVRDILHDANANFYSVAQVDRWINRGRKQVAQKGRCVRYLPPNSGSLSSVTVNSGGAGYTVATVAISAPDAVGPGTVQATATATLVAGAVSAINVVNAGSGYVATPTVTITGTGTGAIATANISNHICTAVGQEVYTLASIAALQGGLTPGLGNLIGVQSIAVSWGAIKPTLARRAWSELQAYYRSATPNYQNYPLVWAQYGQGVAGSFYVWPIPSQVVAMDVDCYFGVLDLSSGQTVDLIPEPWDEPVHYYAAYLAYLNSQRFDDARTMLGEHERLMTQARAVVSTDFVPDPYGDQ